MPQPRWFKIQQSNNSLIYFHNFHNSHMHVMSPVQHASLGYGKAYILQIEILHYIEFFKKNDYLNTVVYYFTLALHPSDQHVLHYITIIKNLQFLTNLCDFIKYIMKYNRLWVTEKLQLALSYTWQLMRLIQHFCLNVTINHYWVFVITSDCDPMWILVKWWGRNMLLVTF